MRHPPTIAAVAALLFASGCGREEAGTKAPAPEPTYASPREAEASLPDALRSDYQRMLECEMSRRAKAGRPLVIDTATVVSLTRRVRAGERAPDTCR